MLSQKWKVSMRVAFVTYEYPPFIIGGAGIYAEKLTRELARLGHDIFVFTPYIEKLNKKTVNMPNLKVIRVKVNNRLPFKALQFWLRLPKKIKEIHKKSKFDIIHFNSLSYWFLRRRLINAPHIATIHHLVLDAIENNDLGLISRIKDISGENSLIIPWIEKWCIESCDKIIAVSNFTKSQILKYYQVDEEKVSVVYNGIDSSTLHFTDTELATTRKRFGLDDKPLLLFVGRVDDRRKGLDILIKALPKILEKVNANLLVVGKGDQTRFCSLADSSVKNNIKFTGFVDDITLKKCYALCDVYVCPSRLEGFGLTILEAMSAAKPIVAAKAGAIPEVLGDETNVILVETEDINSLAEAIYQLLSNIVSNNIFCRNQLFKDKFNWSGNAKAIEHIYVGEISG